MTDDPDDFLEFAFDDLLKDYPLGDLPPVEVKTDKFRGVATNFFAMPIQLLMDLKAAQIDDDGSDILILLMLASLPSARRTLKGSQT